jgi:hypothetical protein
MLLFIKEVIPNLTPAHMVFVIEVSQPNFNLAGMKLVVKAVYTQFKSSLLQPIPASHTVPTWPPTAIVTKVFKQKNKTLRNNLIT